MKFLNNNIFTFKSLAYLKIFLIIVFTVVLPIANVLANRIIPQDQNTQLLEVKIDNPLGGGVSNIPDFIKKIIDIVVLIAVPIITLAVIYSGFLFVKAQGNPEALSTARNTLLYTLIGAAVLLGAWFIAETIVSTVSDIKSTT